ncbi:stealth family protein [Brevibacterium antiquum]|uniref:Stealth protein CR3, conserved region 3 n=1 Tax=Brevibacterium antiquum TaxID=234835 RepID=A0A2H1JQL4_9MICO|nr:stealth family protein [Brevibacterium antiquum]SMX89786.1 Stealth protein CR3, conserved region 3 [Brevibacterium antiquum]
MRNGLGATLVGLAKPVIIRASGEQRYLRLRRSGLKALRSVNRRRGQVQRRRSEKNGFALTKEIGRHGDLLHELVDTMSPPQAAQENFDFVADALDARDIEWWLVEDYSGRGYRIGVRDESKALVASALMCPSASTPAYVKSHQSTAVALTEVEGLCEDPDVRIITVVSPKKVRDTNWAFGFRYGCTIEFWTKTATESRVIIEAPAENRAAKLMSEDEFTLQSGSTEAGRTCRVPSVLNRTMLEDITFPIDAVYTWVDGADPEWIESKRRLEAQLSGNEYHPEANHEARFESKDELKYSLRSVEYFAPWFRRIYIVTSGQVPSWLNLDHPKIRMISHSDIYDAADHLPTFNSNSIISRLHHIPDLSEHYVYLNDDVMLGKPVRPQDFFLPTGLAKVFPSRNHRPFGAPTAEDGPHFNLTRNIRGLLESEFGVTVTRAIKHTPYSMLQSVQFEMEDRFRDAFERTWSSRFRHHNDIVADQLHHYYAQIVGKAVATSISYRYINIRDQNYRWIMRDTLRLRDRSTMCLNDAPVDGVDALSDEEVAHFLESYFPCKSSFEV